MEGGRGDGVKIGSDIVLFSGVALLAKPSISLSSGTDLSVLNGVYEGVRHPGEIASSPWSHDRSVSDLKIEVDVSTRCHKR